MANSIRTLNLEQINETQIRPEEVNLEVIKNRIIESLEKSQNLSGTEMDTLLIKTNEYLVPNLKYMHINLRLKWNNPLLYIIHKKQSKYPRLYELFSKRIEKLVDKFENEYKENHKLYGASEIGKFISKNMPNGKTPADYRKCELLFGIYGTVQLVSGHLERSNSYLNSARESRILANIKTEFSTENLEEILSNPNTTIKNLEEMAQTLFSVDDGGRKYEFSDEFLQGCKNNIERLEEELENKETLEESKYNYYANICYLKSFITYDDAKKCEGVDADNKYKEADELLDKGNFYSFIYNKENLQKFIEDNCFEPDNLYKKVQNLRLFYDTRFNEEKRKTVLNILYNNTKSIEEKFKDSGEKLAALNFFKMNLLFGIGTNEETIKDYFECRESIRKYYSKSVNENDKITGLKIFNIFKNDLKIEPDSKEKGVAEKLSSSLLKLPKTNELYAKAQYECGKYIKNEDKNRAFEYFKNSADKGYDKAKIEVAEYYIEEYNQTKEENIKEDRKKDIETLVLSLPEEYNEKKAEIYEKIDSHKKAIECYNNLVKEASNRKNYMDNILRLTNFFIKIGDCITGIADKIRNKNNNVNNEESSDCYKKAIKNYENSEKILKNIESECKTTLNYKKMNDFENYKLNLNHLENVCFNNLTEEKLKNISESVKNLIACLCFDLSENKNLIYATVNTASESGREKKAKEYLKIAADLGYQKALVKYIETLLNSENDNTKEISDILKKITIPETKYEIAYKLRLKYKELAFKLFEEAANSGNERAKYEVARMLKSGIGIKRNEKKAVELFKELTKSADLDIRRDSIIITIDTFIEQKNKNELKLIIKNYDKNIINDKNLNDKIQLAKFTIAKICKSRINKEKNKQETIELFKELANSPITNDIDIKIKSIIELGYIYFNLWKSDGKNQKYKDNLKKYLEEDFNLYIQSIPEEKLNEFKDKLEFFRILKGSLIDEEDKAHFELAEIYLNGTNIEKDENSAIDYFKYLAKNSANKSIRIDSLIALGDIYAENYEEKSLNSAEGYYNQILMNYRENNDKFIEVQKRIVILFNKKNILNFNKYTEKTEIEKTVTDVIKYLNELEITIEEKKQKFKKFANVLKFKISGGKKNKVYKDKTTFIDYMVDASNDFFIKSINSINK